jgi:transcriptional regulator with XRE-family HTH domain
VLKKVESMETNELLQEYSQLFADLKEIVDKSGLKQNFLAEKIGLDRVSLSRILNGKQNSSLVVAGEIAKACGKKLTLTFE